MKYFPRDKHIALSADAMMRHMLYATLPGVLMMLLFFGSGVGIQIGLATLTALLCECLNAWLRKRPIMRLDVSGGLLTAVLLAIALPAVAPWWVVVTGTAFALLIGKHAFGGTGMNIFNPALVGFCAVYLSFPVAMSTYPSTYVSLPDTLAIIFPSYQPKLLPDAISGATALTIFKVNDIVQDIPYTAWWLNAAWLLGGSYLWWQKIADWRLSLSFFASFFLGVLLLWSLGNDTLNPLNQAALGALIFTACFIITDPTTAATGRLGRIIYAVLAGVLAVFIRQYSNMADSMAFAILFANSCAPMIDSYTRPQYYRGQP